MIKIYKNKGFALLYAILLSGAVLTIGVILMSIITKQMVFSSLGKESEITYYYLANSGRECLTFQRKNFLSFGEDFNLEISKSPVEIECFEKKITLSPDISDSNIFSALAVDINGKKVDFRVQFNPNCINGGSCDDGDGEEEIIDKYSYIAVAEGYSGDPGPRVVKRSAVYVQKAL